MMRDMRFYLNPVILFLPTACMCAHMESVTHGILHTHMENRYMVCVARTNGLICVQSVS